VKEKKQLNWIQGLLWLGIIWLLGACCDRLWFWLDRSTPEWDQADYLNGAINYWEALQTPQWFDADWWRSLWLISPKIPPLTYILDVPFLNVFGLSEDAATLIMLLFSAILLISVFGIGAKLFSISIGLWAAGLCQLLPGLYKYRLEFLLDYPLTAIVTCSFWLLTVWWFSQTGSREQGLRSRKAERHRGRGAEGQRGREAEKQRLQVRFSLFLVPCSLFPKLSWLYSALFGLSLGIALMVKQTSIFFLFLPLFYIFLASLWRRRWTSLWQLIFSLCLSVVVIFPWYRTNWLLMLTSGKRATIDSAIAEGDPALNTFDAWTYYAKILPELISFPLLIVPLVGLIIYFGRTLIGKILSSDRLKIRYHSYNPIIWLLIFLIGGYLLSSANINKDNRYILPLLPVFSVFLAIGLLSWQRSWRKFVNWGTIALASLLMLLNIFPSGAVSSLKALSPNGQNYPYLGQIYPHQEVIQEIIKTSPYLRSTLGILPSTPEINQHNFSWWGNIYHSQVTSRQVGTKESQVEQDARSLDWFITKTGEQGSVPSAQAKIVKLVEENPGFYLHKSWQLPNRDTLNLYHHHQPLVEVRQGAGSREQGAGEQSGGSGGSGGGERSQEISQTLHPYTPIPLPEEIVTLDRVIIPEKTPPGVPIPVTYYWSGSWQQLQSGLVLLTWQAKQSPANFWIHDRAIGMGALNSSRLTPEELSNIFEVIETTAMFADSKVAPGEYILKATYLDRQTRKTYPIATPSVTITIDPNATASPAPELDLVTQLRNVAPNLAKGIEGLDPIFEQTSRINQYDPNQDYLEQAAKTLTYRVEKGLTGSGGSGGGGGSGGREGDWEKGVIISNQQLLDWSYAIALSKVLQQDIEGAIASLQKVIEIDDKNPYNYAYLAFVYLYDWRGKPAEEAIDKALQLNPNIPEIQGLKGVAALMQGNLIKAWQNIAPVIDRL
jgi:4-amino-4-deoxy-L-arabinose transferase-like glycosyltransferase